jgi:hypothetical protein
LIKALPCLTIVAEITMPILPWWSKLVHDAKNLDQPWRSMFDDCCEDEFFKRTSKRSCGCQLSLNEHRSIAALNSAMAGTWLFRPFVL